MTALMDMVLLEEAGEVFVFVEQPGNMPRLNRWSGHYADRNTAWNNLEARGLLHPSVAETLRSKVLVRPAAIQTIVADPKQTLRGFQLSRVTVGH